MAFNKPNDREIIKYNNIIRSPFVKCLPSTTLNSSQLNSTQLNADLKSLSICGLGIKFVGYCLFFNFPSLAFHSF